MNLLDRETFPKTLLIVVLLALTISGIHPTDRLTWILEVFPIFLALPVLIFTFRRFPLSRTAYILISVHAGILMMGGYYTYAKTPLGFWLQDLFDFQRNHSDRIGHFAQGFIPAFIVREVLYRTKAVNGNGWLRFLPVTFAVFISGMYEIVEWLAAVSLGSSAESFLGTQGDVWDTQWDIFLALVGSSTAMLLPLKLHLLKPTK